jgi:hypothetical protein
MTLTRFQLAAGITVISFAVIVLLAMLYRLMGEIVAWASAAAVLVGILVWFVDYTSERWNKPKEG